MTVKAKLGFGAAGGALAGLWMVLMVMHGRAAAVLIPHRPPRKRLPRR